MKYTEPIQYDKYTEVTYTQYNQGLWLKRIRFLAGIIVLPFLYPLILAAKISDSIFRTISEILSIIPYAFGIIIRYEFYKHVLNHCGENVVIGFGTVFFYKNISIGNNVLIGVYNIIHYCDFGDDVLIGDKCTFLSGRKYHNFDRTDIPIAYQGGKIKRIKIGNDTWIGSNAIIMESVGEGCVIGAGSVVTKEVEPYSICAGNPATVIRKRK